MEFGAARDRALFALEQARTAEGRAEAASLLHDLAAGTPERADELVDSLPVLLVDPYAPVRKIAVALAAIALDDAEAHRVLAARLQDSSVDVRAEAVGHLADLVRPTARGALAAALEDEAFIVRFEAARGLAALRHPAGLDVLCEALGRDELRFVALSALGQLGDVRAVPAVKKLFGRWLLPAFDRTLAAGALARMGDPEGMRFLLRRTHKRSAPDRALAIELCGEVQGEGAYERLTELASDRRDPWRGAAARGLGRLGHPGAFALLSGLLEEDGAGDDLLLDAAEGLLMLGTEEAKARIRSAAERASPALRKELLTIAQAQVPARER